MPAVADSTDGIIFLHGDYADGEIKVHGQRWCGADKTKRIE